MYYREFLPHPALQPYIHIYGVLVEEKIFSAPQQEIVPPSVGKGLVFYLDAQHTVEVNNGTFSGTLPKGFILPQGTRSNLWEHFGGFQTFAIIFKPGMFRLFFPFSLVEYLNSLLKIEEVGEPELLHLYEEIHLAQTMEERVCRSNTFLLKQLRNVQRKEDMSAYSLRRIHTDLDLKLGDLCIEMRTSDRHFRRVFTREIGIQPKQYQKLVRINAALAKLGTLKSQKITDVAYQCGYYDQAHFNDTFKEFTGQTPTEYLHNTARVTGSIHWREEVVDGLEIKG